ncbi:UNVERIFIED_CONTAM: hypothetical protein FKN15_038964, partial [Acipenser sinensis]
SSLGAVAEVAAAGVIGTGTHNTGIEHGILPTQVVALTLMTAGGEILKCSDSLNEEIFQATRLHLGSLGVILDLTIQCVPAFRLHELQFPSTLTEPVQNTSSWFWGYAVGYHLLEFLLWVSTFLPRMVPWINQIFFSLLSSGRDERVDCSHRIFTYECLFKQHVQDWAVPIGKTKEALLQLKAWLENNQTVVAHFPVEVRFARGDNILLSPCFQRDSCYMNIIMYRPYGKEVPRDQYWAAYEEIMQNAGGRPHWAKAHSCTRKDFQRMYPGFQKFCSIREQLDPTGMFLNSYLEKVFF